MSNETHQAIAQKAWNKIRDEVVICPCNPEQYEQATSIILAAIEKAYRQGLNEGFGKGKQSSRREAAQPQRSEHGFCPYCHVKHEGSCLAFKLDQQPPATDDEMPFDAERAKKSLDEIGNRSEARHGNIKTSPATDDILFPCPFCGSENVGVEPLVGGFVVDCKDCGGGCGTCHSEQAARNEWNKRKSLTEILKERGIDADKVEARIRAKVAATDDTAWTVDSVWRDFGRGNLLKIKKLVDAHNAALAAERETLEQERLRIWREAPNQPDIQEAVIAKLNLISADALAAAHSQYEELAVASVDKIKPLVDALKRVQVAHTFLDANKIASDALAKVKEGK